MNRATIEQVAESYLNGNRTWSRDKVRRWSRVDVLTLVEVLAEMTGSTDEAVGIVQWMVAQ